MPETWHDFYVMTGIAAAALIGLLFVVVNLTTQHNPAVTVRAARVYVTPTIFHFTSVALIAAVALVPSVKPRTVAIVLIALAVGGLAYAVSVVINLYGRHRPDVTHWTDPLFYALLPALAYLGFILAAVAFLTKVLNAPYYASIAVLALLLIGIRDAWDVSLWASTHPDPGMVAKPAAPPPVG